MTILFLDVDGVLNRYGFRKADPSGWGDFIDHPNVNGYTLNLSKDMGEALNGLDVEIVWCTTWENEADTFVADLVGLPRGLRVMKLGRDWKLGAVIEEINDNPQDFIWIDDTDIDRFFTDAHDCAKENGVRCLLIEPDPRIGITRDDIESIRNFLDNPS